MGAAGLVLAVGGLLFAGTAMHLLGGGRYPAGAPALAVLMVAGGLAWVNGLLGLLIITIDRQRAALGVNVGALAVNAALCIAVVPAWGILAAAWVGVASELVMLGGNLVMLRRWAPRAEVRHG
jgi:O-antigen/teichoic acid export membrane protein